MNRLNTKELIKKASYYTPSKTVTLDAAGGADPTAEIEFQGLDSDNYGVNRFLAGGSGMSQVIATAEFNNGRDTKFEEVHLSCLNQLFKHGSLRGAFEIKAATKMFLTLENLDATQHKVNVELLGYDDFQLQQKKKQHSARGQRWPEPEFVFLPSTEIAANATKKNLKIKLPDFPLRLMRLAFGTDDTGDNLRIAIRQGDERIKPETYISQINDEFASMDIIMPRDLEPRTAFELEVTNDDASAYQLSMLAECYRI